jgi:hypothetical protein
MAIHKAAPADARLSESTCTVCADAVRPVPGGHGTTWVHSDGRVASSRPALKEEV